MPRSFPGWVSCQIGAIFPVPETFFVNADGVVAYRHIGPVTASVLEAQIGALIR